MKTFTKVTTSAFTVLGVVTSVAAVVMAVYVNVAF